VNEWVWSIGGMILTGENWSSGRKTSYSGSLSTTNPTRTDLGWNNGLSGERPATNRLRQFKSANRLRNTWNQCLPRSKHTVSVIKTSQLMLYREIIAVCSQIHTKHINTLCGQNVELYIKIHFVPRSKHTPSRL